MFQGDVITKFRNLRGIEQGELAEKLNVHITTLSRWENNHAEPKASHIKKLCEIFQCTEAEFLNGQPNDTWTLELKFDNSNKELIDMVGDMPCISSITGTTKGAVLTLSGKWDTFRDDAKFQDFIDQLVKARDKIVRLGEDWAN